ncbi:MAG: radical SAM protein [Candidatus Omnitrophica bacterium]|nr:radical SAM protein [Candidatus Omnitrophota bacterium]
MDKQKFSFTSADTLPIKLFLDEHALACIKKRHILPIHVQLNPTNKCNQNCTFCSCGLRDKNKEIPFERATSIIEIFYHLETKAITITGGGEPTLYRDLGKLIDFIYRKGIKIGLVTNGLQLDSIADKVEKLTWCRISFSDQQKAERYLLNKLLHFKKKYPKVDWGLSYVITRYFDKKNLSELINFTDKNKLSHIRIVSDLLDLDNVPDISSWLSNFNDSYGRIIYQRRKDYKPGRNPCYLSLLKPNIGPDGNMYPCCGVQYVLKKASLDFPPSMSMGDNIKNIYVKQKFFDGRRCQRCYYDQYNQIIALMMEDIKHKEFI